MKRTKAFDAEREIKKKGKEKKEKEKKKRETISQRLLTVLRHFNFYALHE